MLMFCFTDKNNNKVTKCERRAAFVLRVNPIERDVRSRSIDLLLLSHRQPYPPHLSFLFYSSLHELMHRRFPLRNDIVDQTLHYCRLLCRNQLPIGLYLPMRCFQVAQSRAPCVSCQRKHHLNLYQDNHRLINVHDFKNTLLSLSSLVTELKHVSHKRPNTVGLSPTSFVLCSTIM